MRITTQIFGLLRVTFRWKSRLRSCWSRPWIIWLMHMHTMILLQEPLNLEKGPDKWLRVSWVQPPRAVYHDRDPPCLPEPLSTSDKDQGQKQCLTRHVVNQPFKLWTIRQHPRRFSIRQDKFITQSSSNICRVTNRNSRTKNSIMIIFKR